jgi:hypothetical protein
LEKQAEVIGVLKTQFPNAQTAVSSQNDGYVLFTPHPENDHRFWICPSSITRPLYALQRECEMRRERDKEWALLFGPSHNPDPLPKTSELDSFPLCLIDGR